MKARLLPALASVFLFTAGVRGDQTFDDAMRRATADYTERLQKAADELNTARKRIADEKAPLLGEMRSAEDRIVTAGSQIDRLGTGKEDASEQRRKLLGDLDAIRKNTTYIETLAHDGLAAFGESLAPGEGQLLSARAQALEQKLDDTSAGPNGQAAIDVAEFLLGRTRRALGGYTAPGRSLIAGNNQVFQGTFAFVGPETYFQADQGGAAGTVRPRAGSVYPVTYVLPSWKPEESSAFFQGKPGMIIADASGGKALRLKETTGTLLEHVQKGGLVAYAIIGVGFLSLVMIAQKIGDLCQLTVDSPAAVRACLASLSSGRMRSRRSGR